MASNKNQPAVVHLKIYKSFLLQKLKEKNCLNAPLTRPRVLEIFQEICDEKCVKIERSDSNVRNLKNSLNRVKTAFRTAKAKGGLSRQKFEESLVAKGVGGGPPPYWKWTVPFDVQHDQLRDELEAKSQKVYSLQQTNSKLNKKLSSLQHLKAAELLLKSKIRKKFVSLSRVQKWRLKQRLVSVCKQKLNFTKSFGLKPKSVSFINTSPSKNASDGGNEILLPLVEEKDSNGDTDQQPKCSREDKRTETLYICDKFNIPVEAYHELAMTHSSLPRVHNIRKERGILNSSLDVSAVSEGNIDIVYQKFDSKLFERAQNLTQGGFSDSKLRVKLNGDGTPMGRHINVVDLCFTILEEQVCTSAYGNYPIVLFKGKENYENLKLALSKVTSSLDTCQSIVVGDQVYEVVQYLGGDYKFLTTVCGLEAPSCTYACIWCKCSIAERSHVDKEWSISDPELGCRTVAEMISCLKAKGKKRFSMKNQPLFPWIPMTHVIVDPLHLFLRISDQLFQHVVSLLKVQDAVECPMKKAVDKGKHLQNLEQYLSNNGIPFSFYVDKGKASPTLTAKSLRGPEYHKLHKIIDIKELMPFLSPEKVVIMQQLWNDFYKIYLGITGEEATITDQLILWVKEETKSWLRKFLLIFQARDITPYMHILCAHVHEFLRLHGSLVKFTQQGCEKLNDILTVSYFRGTNHQGLDALKQLFLKANRVNLLESQGMKRKQAKTPHCSECKSSEHRVNKCPLRTQQSNSAS